MTIPPCVRLYLRALREARGLSQADVAERVGVSSDQFSRWELGKNVPAADFCIRWAIIVGAYPETVFKLWQSQNATKEDVRELAKWQIRWERLTDD